MPLSFVTALNVFRCFLMGGVMVFVWLILGMVYFERFLPPFNRLVPYIMPWKEIYLIPQAADIPARMAFMQKLLDASNRVTEAAFITVVASFALLSAYMTYVYQQRLKRMEENRMLLIKNQEISRRNEFIRYISATIGHEFKNNLGRIKRRLDLVGALPEEVREKVGTNFDKLFADIDIFKKIADEREAGLIDFKRVDLQKMLSEMAGQYSDLAEVSFRPVSPGTAHTAIFAAQALLRTVFENLMDNAIRYKKPGQEKARIELSCGMDADGSRRYVTISFKDEGIGMTEEQSDQCFYKRTVTGEGWGEGLYFVKYVIGLHAGKIRVGKEYTAPDVGTEIIINLPYVEEAINV